MDTPLPPSPPPARPPPARPPPARWRLLSRPPPPYTPSSTAEPLGDADLRGRRRVNRKRVKQEGPADSADLDEDLSRQRRHECRTAAALQSYEQRVSSAPRRHRQACFVKLAKKRVISQVRECAQRVAPRTTAADPINIPRGVRTTDAGDGAAGGPFPLRARLLGQNTAVWQ